MKSKTKPLILLSFFLLISGIFFTQNVNAQSYYNWIQNPSFATYINYCEDSSFESGSFNSGLVYGNWSGSGATFDSTKQNSGVYSILMNSNPEYINYTLYGDYNETLGADIEEFTFYSQPDVGMSETIYWFIYYSDSSLDSGSVSGNDGSWTQEDLTDEINNSKFVIGFSIERRTANTIYFDDFVLSVDDGEGQDEIVFGGGNYWQLGQTSSSYAPYFGNINTVLGRIDNTSCQLDAPSETYKIIQYIDYLDSNSIQYINLYVYGANSSINEGIKIRILYSDGSTDEKTEIATGSGSTWEMLNFGKSWIDSDKYITLIYIFPVSDEIIAMNIDDVGIWSTLPYGYNKFAFSISPQPIEKGSYDFDVYSKTLYTFNGYFYNITDLSLSINGTYQISDNFGIHNGTMTNGYFSLQLNKREFSASPYTLETLSVTIITDEEIFNVNISAYWYPVSGGTTTDSSGTASLILDFFLYGIFFIALPLTISIYIGAMGKGENTFINPSLGISSFVGIETLMGAITLTLGIIELWFMIVIIIMDVVLIFAMLKGRI